MRRPLRLFILLLLLALAGCRHGPPLKVGSNQWPGYEPVYLARDLGLLPADAVKLVELPSSTEVMQYLRNGSLDAGMLTLDEVISLLAEGVPLQVVLVMDVSDGADAVLAKPEIGSLEQIRGRRVGVEISALGALMLESLLQAAHLEQKDIQVVNLPVDQHAQAFREGRVDVLITFEPTRSRLLAEGARELFNSHQIPGRIIDVLAVRREAAREHNEHLHRLLRAYFRARRAMREDPDGSNRRMAPRLGVDPETLKTMFAGMHLPDLAENRDWLGGPRLTRQAERLARMMREWQLIATTPSLDGLATPRYLPAR